MTGTNEINKIRTNEITKINKIKNKADTSTCFNKTQFKVLL